MQLAEHYPGLRGIGWSPRLRGPADVLALEASARQEGLPDFKVWSDGDRPPAYAVRFLAPLDRRNSAALGYDMSSEPLRRDAMQRAAASGEVALSGAVVLKQELRAPGLPGFLLYLPLYETADATPARSVAERGAALAGFVYSPLRAADFFPNSVFNLARDGFAVQVFDDTPGGGTTPESLLFDNLAPQAGAGPSLERAFHHGGRRWHLRFTTLPMCLLTRWSAAWRPPSAAWGR